MLFHLFIHPHHALGRYLSPVCFIGTATGSQGSCMPGFKSESQSQAKTRPKASAPSLLSGAVDSLSG